MKRVFVISALFAALACSNNGLDKPITQELTSEELRANLKKNPLFGDSYNVYRGLAQWIAEDNLRLAKYGTTTYQQLDDYERCGYDKDKAEKEYNTLFPNKEELYRQADSVLNYYRSIQPDSLLTLSFKSKGMTGGFLSKPVFNITATPKKGAIEQFDFEFYFSPKINGIKSLEEIADVSSSFFQRGYQTTPISKETTISARGAWYGDSLSDKSTEEIIRDYDFLYRITDIRYNGKNWHEIPYVVRWVINNKEPINDTGYQWVIQEMIDPDYVDFTVFLSQKSGEVRKEKYPDLAKMYDEFFSSKGLEKYVWKNDATR